jgi:hypothetical protein
MIRPDQVQEIWLSGTEIQYCAVQAQRLVSFFSDKVKNKTGGVSHIRDMESERGETFSIDQLVGQIGEYALSMFLFGEPSRYYIQRMSANINPALGDQGQDILGLNMDCKTSLMRHSEDPTKYHLLVRPKEKHLRWCYVHILVEPNDDKSISVEKPIKIYFTGWASDSDLPAEPEQEGPLKGAYALKVPDLNPLPNMIWSWRRAMFEKQYKNKGVKKADAGWFDNLNF